MKTYLTKNGILAISETQAGFFTNSGEFIRHASFSEVDYLINKVTIPEVNLVYVNTEKGCKFNFPQLFWYFKNGEIPLPKWQFLFSSEDRDDTNYKWETCNNGGDYANFDRHNYFVRLNGDKVEFACLTESYSSSEFHQTWDGRYQSLMDCNDVTLIDVEGDWRTNEWNAEEGAEASLLQGFGQMCKLEDLFQPSTYIPSLDDEDRTPQKTPLTFAEYLGRWRAICKATGKTVRQLAPKSRRRRR